MHCPARHDFGLRYLDTDLPPGYAERVEALLARRRPAARADAAFAWQDELLAELAEPVRRLTLRRSALAALARLGLLLDGPLVLLELLLVDHDRAEERPDDEEDRERAAARSRPTGWRSPRTPSPGRRREVEKDMITSTTP